MTRLEQAVDARLMEIRDVARSGVTERTGKASRFETAGGEERGRRIRGMMAAYPEVERLGDSPATVAKAIERGKGKIYRRVRAAVRGEMEKYIPESRKRTEKPTVPAHAKLTRKCKTCGVMHGKGQHRFHGKGAFHQTHLFAFNPPVAFVVVGKTKLGDEVFYTGRAAGGFVSGRKTDAFVYKTRGAATMRAVSLNAGSRLHGIRFYVESLDDRLFNPPVKIRYCAVADREHAKSVRQYAHTMHYPSTICLARSFKDLPANFRKGILAHEMGHLHYGSRRHTEKDADRVHGVTRRNYGKAKRLEYKRNPSRSGITKIYGNVTRIYLAAGHYDLVRSPRMYGLADGSIWITWGKESGYPRDPDNALVSRRYGRVKEIEAQKTQKHRCDPECKKLQHRYYHPFTEPNMLYQLQDGSLLVVSR